jgi:branched-subunit amino acid transport protein
MTTWLVVLAVGAGSYAFRALPFFVPGRWRESPAVERTLAHAGTAALAALVASGLRHGVDTGHGAGFLVAGAVAVVVAVRGGSMPRVLLAGALAYAVIATLTAAVG